MSERPETADEQRDLAEPDQPEGAPEDVEELDEETRERRNLALAQVRTFGDPVLNSVASPVESFDELLLADAEQMIAIMRDALGVGLAASQLGVMRRLLVFQAGPDATPRAIANPDLEWASEQTAEAEEGCLSLPGIVVDVERALHARVRGQNMQGEPVLLEASGLEARVLQHEIDHLDGVLTLDRTSREQRRAARRALREERSFSPEDIAEPAGAEA
jgi:peptide deformylase